MYVRSKSRVSKFALTTIAEKKKGDNRPSHGLSVRTSIHGRLVPQAPFIRGDHWQHPISQGLVQRGFADNNPVIKAGHDLSEQFQQRLEIHLEKVQGTRNPTGIYPWFVSFRHQGRQKDRALWKPGTGRARHAGSMPAPVSYPHTANVPCPPGCCPARG